MDISVLASQLFPKVQWTGGSHIHVSWFRSIELPFNKDETGSVMKVLYQGKAGYKLFAKLNELFPGFDWYLTDEEFNNLFFVDVYRHLTGKGDSESPDKIKNPVTGNVFHKIAGLKNVYGGIRFWAEFYGGTVSIGFRFRVIKVDEGGEVVRLRLRTTCVENEAQVEEVLEEFVIAEPTHEIEEELEKEYALAFN